MARTIRTAPLRNDYANVARTSRNLPRHMGVPILLSEFDLTQEQYDGLARAARQRVRRGVELDHNVQAFLDALPTIDVSESAWHIEAATKWMKEVIVRHTDRGIYVRKRSREDNTGYGNQTDGDEEEQRSAKRMATFVAYKPETEPAETIDHHGFARSMDPIGRAEHNDLRIIPGQPNHAYGNLINDHKRVRKENEVLRENNSRLTDWLTSPRACDRCEHESRLCAQEQERRICAEQRLQGYIELIYEQDRKIGLLQRQLAYASYNATGTNYEELQEVGSKDQLSVRRGSASIRPQKRPIAQHPVDRMKISAILASDPASG